MKRQFCLPCFLELKKAGKHDITRIAGGKNLKITCWRCKRRRYTSAAAASGKACKPGPAKVTMISKGAKHPYHLIKQAGGGSTVYGWVNAADVQSETDAAIDKLAGLGVINSPDYWKNAVAGGKVAYLDILFTQAAAKITKAGPRTADVKSGVGALVKAGVINTPEYWLQNYGKLQSLDLLLCALGGAV